MNREAREAISQSVTYIDAPAEEHCTCLPLSSLHRAVEEENREREGRIPATQDLNSHLRSLLATYFPRSTPLSLLHLHISQLEPTHSVPQSAYQRSRYHAPDNFLEQVLVYARRVIRRDDQILVHAGTGAVILFPEVDQDAIQAIAERVYQSISLLQAETVIPPLRRVTNILIGVGSYPKPATSLEQMLYQASLTVQTLTLRPAISRQTPSMNATHLLIQTPFDQDQHLVKEGPLESPISKSASVPFLQLPTQLPRRLKQLVPYHLALKIRCAPVGRDHDRLTIAMADPTDSSAIIQLEEATGLSIFAVSCDPEALDALLAHKW
jgi:GGDEF domain-containing protein